MSIIAIGGLSLLLLIAHSFLLVLIGMQVAASACWCRLAAPSAGRRAAGSLAGAVCGLAFRCGGLCGERFPNLGLFAIILVMRITCLSRSDTFWDLLN